MIDVMNEQLLTFSQAAKALPNRPSVATIWRWATAGVRGIKLESILVGGTRYTSAERLQEFCDNLTAAANGGMPAPVNRRTRRAEIEQAEREFEELVSR
jgi:hypothetical protein